MQPELIGKEILLRPYQETDVPRLTEAARESIGHMAEWMPWCHPNYATADSEGWLKYTTGAWTRGDEYNFAVMDKASGRLLGGCGLNKLDKEHRCANLGYWVRRTALGRGIATEASLIVARYAFETLQFRRLEVLVAVTNLPSQRVAIKTGAVAEGIARKRLLVRGVSQDARVFSLVSEDLAERRSE